jgi:hypothetical protein
MPYLKKDGTPRRIPKHYWGIWEKVNEKVKPKAKKSTVEGVKKMRANFRKKCKIRGRVRKVRKKMAEELALENAINNGTLDELHELMQAVPNRQTPLYTKDGTLVPTSKRLIADYDADLAETVLERMSSGDTVRMLEKQGVITLRQFRKWYRNVPDFKRSADLAEVERTQVFDDKLQELTEEVRQGSIGPREATFIADQYKWLMERLNPKFMQKNKSGDLNVQVNDGKVQFQIVLAPNKEITNDNN